MNNIKKKQLSICVALACTGISVNANNSFNQVNGFSNTMIETNALVGLGTIKDNAIKSQIEWQNSADIDLHVKTPDEKEVFFGNKKETYPNGGRVELDHDNLGDKIDSGTAKRFEHIVVDGNAQSGEYQFFGKAYDMNGNKKTPYKMIVSKGDVFLSQDGVFTHTGQIAPSLDMSYQAVNNAHKAKQNMVQGMNKAIQDNQQSYQKALEFHKKQPDKIDDGIYIKTKFAGYEIEKKEKIKPITVEKNLNSLVDNNIRINTSYTCMDSGAVNLDLYKECSKNKSNLLLITPDFNVEKPVQYITDLENPYVKSLKATLRKANPYEDGAEATLKSKGADFLIGQVFEIIAYSAKDINNVISTTFPKGMQLTIFDDYKAFQDLLNKAKGDVISKVKRKLGANVDLNLMKGFIVSQAIGVFKDYIQKDIESRLFSGNNQYVNEYGKFATDVTLGTMSDLVSLYVLSPSTFANPAAFVASFKVSLTVNLATTTTKKVVEVFSKAIELSDLEDVIQKNVIEALIDFKELDKARKNLESNKRKIPAKLYSSLKRKVKIREELIYKQTKLFKDYHKDKFFNKYSQCSTNDIITAAETAFKIINDDKGAIYKNGLVLKDWDNNKKKFVISKTGMKVRDFLSEVRGNNHLIAQRYQLVREFVGLEYGKPLHTAYSFGEPLGGDLMRQLDELASAK